MTDSIQISFKDKVINLHFSQFDDDINVDDLTNIDYNNIFAELITIPALMNRVGIWKAEATNAYDDFKLECDIYGAKQSEYYRRNLTTKTTDSKGANKMKYPTVDEVSNAVLLDDGVQLRRKKLLRLKKEAEYLDSLYWAVKSKEGKLNRLSETFNLTPPEFEAELTERKWNGILIRIKEKLIK